MICYPESSTDSSDDIKEDRRVFYPTSPDIDRSGSMILDESPISFPGSPLFRRNNGKDPGN